MIGTVPGPCPPTPDPAPGNPAPGNPAPGSALGDHAPDRPAPTRRRLLAGLGGLAPLGLAVPRRGARADAPWPAGQTVAIVIPYAPDGAPDILAQVITRGVGERLGGNFVMDHKPGASTTLAARAVARAKPDGMTLLMGTVVTFTTAPHALRNPGFDALADFAHVTMIADTQYLLVANPRWPSLDALVAEAKRRPGQLSYATWGVGTAAHLLMVDLAARQGIELLHVPYSGSPPALTDTIAGRTDLMFSTYAPAKPHVESGRLRAFAIPSARRAASLPDVPTMAEIGVPDFVSSGWFCLSAPLGTPAPILARLETALVESFTEPATRARLDGLGLATVEWGPVALRERIARESAQNKVLMRRAGIEPE
ncbi:tripartite tricarboxylate transporter substrate binding protein [Roseomonas sp. NAR14]|uniref:Tripartite tricarboxylate transporter substrate binding protein n=1 Tax=Roseomonas acroporae TaxID=2937791 RepID=A0A9X1YAJ4_9PROT|nr:tripartite tricarboxylate transporter substrate binding protein [Roseomonas acroporae]MCK8782896.1 tripartite tricarboxylate transporter substrate binding protein [Roseomonas acroporae]